ncbi:MAG: ABC transporter ATP-binding protein, partial [Oscillospiraceae bacterium]
MTNFDELPVVISAKNVGKHFKIYKDKPMTLKDRALAVIKKSYDEFWALKDISLDIHKGEAVGLIGHNGCGKSTLLKLFTRIIYPEKGEIIVDGQVSSLLELGAGFHQDFTGRENIYTNASIFGMKKKEIDDILEDVIDFSELGEFIDNPVRTYSSGMYMRLAFSVAIHVKPEILLIDEILAVGDANFQKKCLDKITEFKKNGVTIVIVSHDLSTIERICDKAVWLDSGIIRKQGKPKSVVNAYLEQMAENQNDKVYRKIDIVGTDNDVTLASNEYDEENPAGKPRKDSDTRWGNRDIEIVKVELLDKNNAARAVFNVEDEMSIKISYKVNKSVPEVCFGIGIFGADGVQRYGTNTHIDEL